MRRCFKTGRLLGARMEAAKFPRDTDIVMKSIRILSPIWKEAGVFFRESRRTENLWKLSSFLKKTIPFFWAVSFIRSSGLVPFRLTLCLTLLLRRRRVLVKTLDDFNR